MTIKQTFFSLLVSLVAITTQGQSIKDYYIPEASFNKVSFYSPSKTGGRTGMTRRIYYIKGNDNYQVMDVHLMNEQVGSIFSRFVTISNTEIKMTNSTSTSVLGETNKKTKYNPAIILLKMPPANQTVTWKTTEHKEDEPTKFIASWTTVTINGEKLQTIKVVSQYTGMTSKLIQYYVKGIGLWKSEITGTTGTITTDKFDGLEYDASSN